MTDYLIPSKVFKNTLIVVYICDDGVAKYYVFEDLLTEQEFVEVRDNVGKCDYLKFMKSLIQNQSPSSVYELNKVMNPYRLYSPCQMTKRNIVFYEFGFLQY